MTGEAEPAHLRQVLGAAALGAGLRLREVTDPEVLSCAQARACAQQWGLTAPEGQDPAQGGGVVVVLVDGLGLELLEERKGHAPVLRAALSQARVTHEPEPEARTCLPSTTAAALTTLGTGALPGRTGMVGYSVLNPLTDRGSLRHRLPSPQDSLCLISWEGQAPDPRQWQEVPTVFERLEAPDRVRTTKAQDPPLAVSVGPARFAGSGLTLAGLRGATHVGADRLEQRPEAAAAALRRGTPLVYLYVRELDHAGHRYGWRSRQWLHQLERIDAVLAELRRHVPRGTRVLVTADHGMVDTDEAHRVDISHEPVLSTEVVAVAGEPRFTHLYVSGSEPELATQVAQRWRDHLGERALWVGTRDQSSELLGPLSERARSVVGDVVVAMADTWVVVDTRVHSPQAITMPGVHGSLTERETRVPLLVMH